MRTISQAGDLNGKRVLMRADFDVPVVNGSIGEPFRIERQKKAVQWLMERGARVVLAAHITEVSSFQLLVPSFEKILGAPISFLRGPTSEKVVLLENLRQDPGEEANDEAFARKIAEGCDIYMNNAFAVSHRKHASVDAVTKILPSYAGPLIVEETTRLTEVLSAPPEGKIVFMGGAKVETKMPAIKNLLGKAEVIALGGKIANEFGESADARIRVPTDFAEGKFDIGPETARQYAELARDAKMVVWNGPMGKFEDERFAQGTRVLAEAVAKNGNGIVGGGDTIAALGKFSVSLEKFSFVSTGGGAMLAFLADERLPGLEALGYYQSQ